MNQLFHQHTEHFDRFGKIGADENFEAVVFGACRMPALGETFSFAAR